jgi:Galactose oxidase, central domain
MIRNEGESQQASPDENSFKKFHFSCTGVLRTRAQLVLPSTDPSRFLGHPWRHVCRTPGSLDEFAVRPTSTESRAVRRSGRAGWPPSPELFDPATGTWTTNGALTTPRRNHTATLLPNGKVLIAGGFAGKYLARAELYNPATRMFTAIASMSTHQYGHTATLLANGKVLVEGGTLYSNGVYRALASAELFDPPSESWATIAAMTTHRALHTATLLPDGQVLHAGANHNAFPYTVSGAEWYDPTTGTSRPTGGMSDGRESLTATLLADGTGLVVAGCRALTRNSA